MRRCAINFFKVQNEIVNLPALIQDFSPVVYNYNQLSVSQLYFFRFFECCLSDRSFCSSKCALTFEQTICLINLHGAQLEKLVGNYKPKTYLFFIEGTYVCMCTFHGDFNRVNILLKEASKHLVKFGRNYILDFGIQLIRSKSF